MFLEILVLFSLFLTTKRIKLKKIIEITKDPKPKKAKYIDETRTL